MIEPLPHPDEENRLKALRALHLLDTPIEERFERVTRMVCRLLDVPIALFNLIDEDRQHYKSVQGLTNASASLDAAFCTHALQEEDMLLVPDTSKDQRFFDNPFVTGEFLNIGFYAGCPVHTPDGLPIGTLCAIDTRPRAMSPEQLTTLRDLAAMLETELKFVRLSAAQRGLIEELNNAQRLALIDPLTRLWNRAGIMNIAGREWSDAARQKNAVTFVMADIDHFKAINDTFGHAAGDEVLRVTAKRLVELLRTEDAVGRVGGEEFLIVLTKAAPQYVHDTLERIRTAIESQPVTVGSDTIHVTMSFGVSSVVPRPDMMLETLVGQADKALYDAKKAGRNCVRDFVEV